MSDQNFQGNYVADSNVTNWPEIKCKPDLSWEDPRFTWLKEWVKKQKSKSK